MHELTGKQKRHLRGLAHALKPIAHVGKQGVTEAFLHELDEALERHELVKVKFIDHKDRKAELTDQMAERLDCAVAGRVGHQAILYRQATDPERRQVRLPPTLP